MMKTYLGDETEALDGFEFLSMAEAGELAHWEIVQKIAHTAGERRVAELRLGAPCVSTRTRPTSMSRGSDVTVGALPGGG